MIEIIVKKDKVVLRKIPMPEGEYLIGREPNCDIQLAGSGVSRRHAKLLYHNNKLIVKDLESSNGTYLNKHKISERSASLQDTIQISGYSLAFEKTKSNKPGPRENNQYKPFYPSKFVVRPLYLCLAIFLVGLLISGFFLGGNNHRSSDPHFDIVLQKVEAYQKTGNYQFAIQELHKALKDHPGNPHLSNLLNELQKRDAVEREILHVVSSIEAKDYEDLANAETALRGLRGKYPDLEEIDFWLGLAAEEIAKGKISTQSQENAEELKEIIPDSGRIAAKTNKPPIKRQRSNTTLSLNNSNSRKKTATMRQPVPNKTAQEPTIAAAAPPPFDDSTTVNQNHPLEANARLELSEKEWPKHTNLTEHQKEEAKELYYQAYKIMAYKSKTAYLKALAMFRKAQETAPDPNFDYYQKAGQKIELCKERLTEY